MLAENREPTQPLGERAVLALGSCKWTAGPMSASERAKLKRLAGVLVSDANDLDLYFFSRAGFDARLVADARADPKCRLIATDDLF